MTFGLISFIILMIAAILFYDRNKILYLYIFFIPFNSTALIKTDSFSISLPLALFFILLMRWLVDKIYTASLPWPRLTRRVNTGLLLMGLLGLCSQIMPLFLDMEVLDVYSSLLTYAEPIALRPKMQYVTQLVYLTIGLFTTYLLVDFIKSFDIMAKSVKIYFYALIFVLFWGWFEFLCGIADLYYPFEVFNHIGLSKFGVNFLDGMPRISSVTLEPSVFSHIMSWALVYIYFYRLKKEKPKRYKIADVLLLIIVVAALLLAQSSTGLIAVGIFLIFIFIDIYRMLKGIRRIMLLFSGILLFALISPIFFLKLMSKMDSYSGFERAKSFIFGWDYFLQSPILGIGWGVFPVWDILLCIVVATGLMGLVVFLNIISDTYILNKRAFKHRDPDKAHFAKALWKGFIMLLLLSQLSGFLYYEQYFWFIFGLSIASAHIILKEKIEYETDAIHHSTNDQ